MYLGMLINNRVKVEKSFEKENNCAGILNSIMRTKLISTRAKETIFKIIPRLTGLNACELGF